MGTKEENEFKHGVKEIARVAGTSALAETREGLAGEASDVDVDFAFWVDVWVVPSISSYFERGKIFPDKRSGFRPTFGLSLIHI